MVRLHPNELSSISHGLHTTIHPRPALLQVQSNTLPSSCRRVDEPSRPKWDINDNGDKQRECIKSVEIAFSSGKFSQMALFEFNDTIYRPNLL